MEAAVQEKEYFGATVLLVDHKSGSLGIEYEDEKTGKMEKAAFTVDPDWADVSDAANQWIEFSKIQVGHRVDLFTEIDADGKEKVYQVIDRSTIEE